MEFSSLNGLDTTNDKLEVNARMDDISSNKISLLEGRTIEVNFRGSMLFNSQRNRGTGAFVFNSRVNDDGAPREMVFVGVSQG
jgi:hypothetical protein